jgi:4-amino-4-deoxy-L-arabinose transferase-like glycosyltransferase
MLSRIRRWLAAHPCWTLTLLVIAALGPQLAKPFNLDDPLFLWEARQIQAHPGDPLGFNVNWFASATPMSVATENPPGAAYYLAAAASAFGWSEGALHAAFLLPALAVILGTWRLARRFCDSPQLAAGVTLFTPVFLVSSGTVMSDTLMLAFWIWAVVFWVEGSQPENLLKLSVAAALIALAVLTKYYGVCLLPLLVAYSLMQQRRLGRWVAVLLIPLAAMCAYQWITRALYGRALMTDTVEYTGFAKGIVGVSRANSALLGLAYTGGCLAAMACFLPLIWHRRSLAWLAGSMIIFAVTLACQNGLLQPGIPLTGLARGFAEGQTSLWATVGLAILFLAGADLSRRRDAGSLLLCLWVVGTFVFAAFLNWTVNGRSILPMTPAVGILIARGWEQKRPLGTTAWTPGVVLALAASAILSLLVARSDAQVAQTARRSAQATFAKYSHGPGKLWFQGHWGYQYYMDALGAVALDLKQPALQAGDFLAVPLHNCFIFLPKPDAASLVEVLTEPGPTWLTTWSPDVGAGFYSFPGPLPFAFGRVPPDQVAVYRWGTNSPARMAR